MRCSTGVSGIVKARLIECTLQLGLDSGRWTASSATRSLPLLRLTRGSRTSSVDYGVSALDIFASNDVSRLGIFASNTRRCGIVETRDDAILNDWTLRLAVFYVPQVNEERTGVLRTILECRI